MFGPVERKKVADQIASSLQEAILGGRLSPGDALPSERELATRYEVNRSSVREALRRLESLGLVEIRQGGATRVRDFLVSAGLQVLPHLVQPEGRLDRDILRDLYEMRAMLLGWCAERAAVKADAEDVERLERIADALSEGRAGPAELQRLDYDFYEVLVQVIGNRVLALFSNVVREVYMSHADRFLPLYRAGVFDPANHRRAVEAIRARDPQGAGAALRAHADSALRALKETWS